MSDPLSDLNATLAEYGQEQVVDIAPEATAFFEYKNSEAGKDPEKYKRLRNAFFGSFYKYVAKMEPNLLFERSTEKTWWHYNEITGVYDDWTDTQVKELVTRLLIANGLRGEGKISAVRQIIVNYRAMFPERGVNYDSFDSNDEWFHAKNGWVNVSDRTFEEHTPKRLSCRVSAVEFDLEAVCPTYDKMLDSDFMLKKDQVRVIDQFSGLLLTGDISHQKMLTLIGKPGCGKSTLLDAWKAVLGDMATSNALTDITGDRFRFLGASLIGRTLCHFDEVDVKRSEMGSNLGNLITGLTFRVERKGENSITNIKNKLKCVLTANSMPASAEIGIFRRILFIEFTRSFYDEDVVDRDLPKKLDEERAGILNRMLRGLADIKKMGRFTVIEGHEDLIEDYKISSNTIAEFLDEYFEPQAVDIDLKIPTNLIYNTYKRFLGDAKFKMILTPQRFGQILKGQPLRAFNHIQPHISHGKRYWMGLKIKDSYRVDDFAEELVPDKSYVINSDLPEGF